MHFMGTIFNKLICFVASMPRSSVSRATGATETLTGATPVKQTPKCKCKLVVQITCVFST